MKLNLPLGRLFLHGNERPVPLQKIRLLRRLSIGSDTLFPPDGGPRSLGKDLRNPFLAQLLADRELGFWALGASTLNFLEERIKTTRPRCILEFGSGLSTVCLARYMVEGRPESGDSASPLVISIDQSAASVQSTREMLAANGLGDRVRVFHAPLEPRAVEGHVMNCYSMTDDAVEFIAKARPDFVLIDGPFAEPGARFGTLPLVRAHLSPGARFFLDDALRDGEIDAALLWMRLLKGVEVQGIIPLDKGLLSGCISQTS